MKVYTSKTDIINRIADIDDALRICKELIDNYSGATREDLGDEFFDELISISNRVVSVMLERMVLAKRLNEEYGIFVMGIGPV